MDRKGGAEMASVWTSETRTPALSTNVWPVIETARAQGLLSAPRVSIVDCSNMLDTPLFLELLDIRPDLFYLDTASIDFVPDA